MSDVDASFLRVFRISKVFGNIVRERWGAWVFEFLYFVFREGVTCFTGICG